MDAAAELTTPLGRSPLREAMRSLARRPEPELLPTLLEQARLEPEAARRAHELALRIAGGVRQRSRDRGRAGLVQGLLQEFALSSQEGVALMCLAEALLRIPDAATRDALIRDKIRHGDWEQHLGHSPSLFVNAATWGLVVTGRLVATHSDAGLSTSLRRIVARGGEPLIRKGVDLAMRMMGQQFVTGETIEQALANARPREAEGFRYSYDMLGEAALTARDAQRYLAAYEHAIHAIGAASAGRGIHDGPGISIKLSALHPRYTRAQVERVMAELYPRLRHLAQLARRHDIGLNIDAEESDRLELSLDLLERLCHEPSMAGWNGIGFVIQAYSKRCTAVTDAVIDLARRTSRRLMVRLVKGAYWDSEIKRAQVDGLEGYPVFTRKAHTDVAYLACARRLLAAPEAVYPQFATHNAHTLAAVVQIAGSGFHGGQYEFQCLHGMGEPLYEQVVGSAAEGRLGRPCRIYAPVGSHETLLAYLVRRLLENGSNSSFVNRIADESIPLEALVEDPVRQVEAMAAAEGVAGAPHPAIALPVALFDAQARRNSRGLDLAHEPQLATLGQALAASTARPWTSEPLLAFAASPADPQPVLNPADLGDRVGEVTETAASDVPAAVGVAVLAAPRWAATAATARAAILESASDRLEAETPALCALLVREAGKTFANAVAEVREAVDFLRYYAAEARHVAVGPQLRPLGAVACISPWNFPLAIFTGQVAAALAAGNSVLAKPAEQTPLIAAAAVRSLHAAGVPHDVLQLLPGRGEVVGAALVGDARIGGVLFTGSTEVARLLQRSLAGRLGADGQPVPLVAETGGQNAMIVDSSALTEQVVQDALSSAFDSAGQRCSALRVLCVQDEAAGRLLEMLLGAMAEQQIGDPRRLAVDIGPVIDAPARAAIERHIESMRARGRRVWQPLLRPHGHDARDTGRAADAFAAATRHGHFVAPTVIEIDGLAELQHEVFGPVLHLLRYQRGELPALLEQINASGYGLTCGVHTRIDETVVRVAGSVEAGNVYVNRNIVGAVVGVQPFGGEGLSGTGPKAGGPLYLLRLQAGLDPGAAREAVRRTGPVATAPVRGFVVDAVGVEGGPMLGALRAWALAHDDRSLATACQRLAAATPVGPWRALPGPTGEANLYAVLPRERVLCLAGDVSARLAQLAAVLAVGSRALWPAAAADLRERLPAEVRERVDLVDDWRHANAGFDAVLHAGSPAALTAVLEALSNRPGPIVGVTHMAGTDIALERLLRERSLSVNTTAAGGNASLMTMG